MKRRGRPLTGEQRNIWSVLTIKIGKEFCRERPPRRSVDRPRDVPSHFVERRGGRSLQTVDQEVTELDR